VSIIFCASIFSVGVGQSRACDLCGCYTPQLEAMEPGMAPSSARAWWSGFYGAVAEQFTHFGTVQIDGDEVPNPTGQYERRTDTIVGLEFVISGEHKDVDRFRGKPAEDTGITSVFLGPRIVASRGRWSAEFDVDLPVLIDNTALQVVPDYRVRGGISFHF
jgi:hypothetical protein